MLEVADGALACVALAGPGLVALVAVGNRGLDLQDDLSLLAAVAWAGAFTPAFVVRNTVTVAKFALALAVLVADAAAFFALAGREDIDLASTKLLASIA